MLQPNNIIHGDCLELMQKLPDKSVDAVITDPPYCSGARSSAEIQGRGGMSRKEVWKSKPLPNDRMTTTGFVWMMREISFEVQRVLKQGGSFLTFIDWRQYPQMYGAIESTNLRVQMMVVWDKESMALGNGFRNQHELILHAANGVPNIYDKSIPNVLRVKRINSSEIHPTEKPVELIEKLIKVVTPKDGIVLDPFLGSGTTSIACIRTGRRYIGIEIDPGYFEVSQKRIELECAQMNLFNLSAERG